MTRTNFSSISNDVYSRVDFKYHYFTNEYNWNIFKSKSNNLISLSEILIEDYNIFNYEEDQLYKGIPTGQSYIDKDGEIIDYNIVTKEDHPNRLKYKVEKDNILISSLRLANVPAVSFDHEDLDTYVFSNGFYIFRVKKGWNKRFITHVLRNKKLKYVLDNNIYRGIGISAYKTKDLFKIKIPYISLEAQEKAEDRIEELEQKISNLKNNIKDYHKIVDEVFQKHFNFDYDQFMEIKNNNNKTYIIDYNEFSNNRDLRFSAKFHRPSAEYVNYELRKYPYELLNNVTANPIMTGQTSREKDYSEDSDCYYITMAGIKTWKLDLTDMKKVSNEYEKNKALKKPKGISEPQSTYLKYNDILMMRSGEGGIGKVAIVEEELKAIFSDFLIRIRVDEKKIIPKFAYYYFSSKYFQYLIEINKKGLGNNTNIFPNIIQEFPIPKLSLEEQRQLVNKVDEQLNNNQEIENKLTELRDEIDYIIESSLINQK